MKILIFTLLMISSMASANGKNLKSNIFFKDFEKLAPALVSDRILLMERMKESGLDSKRGEVFFHKVGNGIQGPVRTFVLELMNCQIDGSDYKLIILVDSKNGEHAVVTNNKSKENYAEFLRINHRMEYVNRMGFEYYLGSNPLKGQMFQLQMLKNELGLLKLVVGSKVIFSTVTCQKN